MRRLYLRLGALVCFLAGGLLGWLAARGFPESAATAAEEKTAARPAVPPDDGKVRVICFGAHPDDCEIRVAGVGSMWAAKGHHVKLVSVTNGDIGHWRDAG